MSNSDRENFLVHISKLCDEYGPWAVLWVATQALRPAFKAIEPQRPRQPLKEVRDVAVKLGSP